MKRAEISQPEVQRIPVCSLGNSVDGLYFNLTSVGIVTIGNVVQNLFDAVSSAAGVDIVE